ncbi:TPA: hypothetical protein QCG78_004396 [Enterobacter asburiae]|uniref:hypothetical protein n=1 Tax=Enterobacter asburiae TaxID=61645 RepID=UPI001595D4A2|nr:hypothetical protein [Enterobacter asburiae]HEC5301819.1 hypothetical protein [Enterobacter asburiae]
MKGKIKAKIESCDDLRKIDRLHDYIIKVLPAIDRNYHINLLHKREEELLIEAEKNFQFPTNK